MPKHTDAPPDIIEAQRTAGRYYAGRRVVASKHCAVCGNAFDGIAKAMYCGNACKVAAYRSRKKSPKDS